MSDTSNSTGFRKFGTGDGRVTGVERTGPEIAKQANADWTDEDQKGLEEETFQDPSSEGQGA